MDKQTQIAAMDSPKRRGRGCFRWLGGAVVLVLVLILAGTIYESVAEAADLQVIPLPVKWSMWAATACTSTARARAAPP